MLLYNEVRFESELFGDEAIVPETRVIWTPINSHNPTKVSFKLLTTQLELQDEFVNMDELTELEDASVFSLIEQPAKT